MPKSQPPIRAAEDAPSSEPSELALMGHDLRAALADVTGALALITPDALAPKDHAHLDRAISAAATLTRLLDGAQRLVSWQEADGTGIPEPIDLSGFVADLSARWTDHAAERGRSFTASHPPAPLHFLGHRRAMERILSNLIGNALTHSRGTVHLAVETADSPPALVLRVIDTGAGLPPAVLRNASVPRTTGPHGHGIAIARLLAARIGGALSLTNRDGGGAEARLAVPLTRAQPGCNGATSARIDGLHILLVEDSVTQALLLRQMLADLGAQVTLASDGPAALARLPGHAFDAAVIDATLPGCSGAEVIAGLRAGSGPAAAIPVLALTADAGAAAQAEILAAGADAVAIKPFRNAADLAAALAEAGIAARHACDPLPVRRLFRIAGPAATAMAQQFVTDLVALRDRLREAARTRPVPDHEGLRHATHVLVALAGSAGHEALTTLARRLNQLVGEGGHAAEEVVSLALSIAAETAALITCIRIEAQDLLPPGSAQ